MTVAFVTLLQAPKTIENIVKNAHSHSVFFFNQALYCFLLKASHPFKISTLFCSEFVIGQQSNEYAVTFMYARVLCL